MKLNAERLLVIAEKIGVETRKERGLIFYWSQNVYVWRDKVEE